MISSRIPGFYNLSPEERAKKVVEFANLTENDISILQSVLPLDDADRMIENVIGSFSLPYGIATNFLINGKDYLIPMVIEEPSVVAAASNAARLARNNFGFMAEATYPVMIGQIQVKTDTTQFSRLKILGHKEEILSIANEQDQVLKKLGGGAVDLSCRIIDDYLVVHLLVNVKDAMGANIVNTMCESVASKIEELTDGKVILRIISNLAVERLARARAVFGKDDIGGSDIVDRIISATDLANSDPFRCATHNKGIMNGIDALVIATGNDFRAVEAGAHAYASLGGYHSLTSWEKAKDGDLAGSIELPMPVGVIGGGTMSPYARLSLKILGVKTSTELSCVAASLGLAQNFAALRALVSEGIQKGHMRLHAKNIVKIAMDNLVSEDVDYAAKFSDKAIIDKVSDLLVKEGSINVNRAKEILKDV
ncbi:MAG TPA: hydroxymethylglutaryl-CoA reductase, degradative [Halobacteria archaeon]|jgi:hydroxymethylglutaryl-CoA reductase|nr:hydroxymethylglutaryl-CoA reductase, degradative [Halobacteria archaeon]